MQVNKIGFKCVPKESEGLASVAHTSKRCKYNSNDRPQSTPADRSDHMPNSCSMDTSVFMTSSDANGQRIARITNERIYDTFLQYEAAKAKKQDHGNQAENMFNLPVVLKCCVNGQSFDTKMHFVDQARTSKQKQARNTGPRPLTPLQMYEGAFQLAHNIKDMNDEQRRYVQSHKPKTSAHTKASHQLGGVEAPFKNLDNHLLPGSPPLWVAKQQVMGYNNFWAFTLTDVFSYLISEVSGDNLSAVSSKTQSQKLQTSRIPFEFIRRVQAVMRAEMLTIQALLCEPGTHANVYAGVAYNPCSVLYMQPLHIQEFAKNSVVITGSLATDCVDTPTHLTKHTLFDEALEWAKLQMADNFISSITQCDKASIDKICESIVKESDSSGTFIDKLWASMGLMHYLKNNPATEDMVHIDSYSCAIIETLYYYIYHFMMMIDNRNTKNDKIIGENVKKINTLHRKLRVTTLSSESRLEIQRKIDELIKTNAKLNNVNFRNGAVEESNGQWSSSLVKRSTRGKSTTARKDSNFTNSRALLENWMFMLQGSMTWMLYAVASNSDFTLEPMYEIIQHKEQAKVQTHHTSEGEHGMSLALDTSGEPSASGEPSKPSAPSAPNATAMRTASSGNPSATSATVNANGKRPISSDVDDSSAVLNSNLYALLKDANVGHALCDHVQESDRVERDEDEDEDFDVDVNVNHLDTNADSIDAVMKQTHKMWELMEKLFKQEQVYLNQDNGKIYPLRIDKQNAIRSIAYVMAPQPKINLIGMDNFNAAIEFVNNESTLTPTSAVGIWKQTGPSMVLPDFGTACDTECQMNKFVSEALSTLAFTATAESHKREQLKLERMVDNKFEKLSNRFPQVMNISTSPTRTFLVFIEIRLVTTAIKRAVDKFKNGEKSIVATGNTSYHAVCLEASSNLKQHMHFTRKTPGSRYQCGVMSNYGPDNSQTKLLTSKDGHGFNGQANVSRAPTFSEIYRLPYAHLISVSNTLLPNAKIRPEVLKECNLGDGESLEVCSTTYEVAGGNSKLLADLYNRNDLVNSVTRQQDFLIMLLIGCSHIAHITHLATWGLSHGVNYPVKKSEVNTAPDYPHLFYTVYQIYVQSIADVCPSCCGTRWEGSYPSPISLGTTFAGLDNINFHMDQRNPCTMQLNADTHLKLYKEICRTTFVRIGTDQFSERPKSTVGIPFGLIPGVHQAADEYAKALIRTQDFLRCPDTHQSDLSILPITPRAQKIGSVTKTPYANAYCTNSPLPEMTKDAAIHRQHDTNNSDLRMCILRTWSKLMDTASMTDSHLMNPYQNGVEPIQIVVLIASAISAIARSHAAHLINQQKQQNQQNQQNQQDLSKKKSAKRATFSAEQIADDFHQLMVSYINTDAVKHETVDSNTSAIYNMKAAVGIFYLSMLYPHSHKNNTDIMHPALAKLFPHAFFQTANLHEAFQKGIITAEDKKAVLDWFKPYNCTIKDRCAWYSGIRALVVRFIREGPRHDLTPKDYKDTSIELERTVRASYWFYSHNGTRAINASNPLFGIKSPTQVSRIHFTGVFTPRTESENKTKACSSIVGMSAPHFQQLCHMMATRVTDSLQVRHMCGQYTIKASSDTDKQMKQSVVVGCGTEKDTQGELSYRNATCIDAVEAQSFNTSQLIAAITKISEPLAEKQRLRGGILQLPASYKNVDSKTDYKKDMTTLAQAIGNGTKSTQSCFLKDLPWRASSSASGELLRPSAETDCVVGN